MTANSNVKDTIEAVKGIVEAVPVYEDLVQPAAKELGKGLLTVSKLVNVALSPLSGLVWGYEKILKYLQPDLTERLKDVPEENITTPDPAVAVPAIEALRYTAHKEELREMFSNLIATAMDKATVVNAHPSFVEIIKQITPDVAKILYSLDNHIRRPLISVHSLTEGGFKEIKNNFSNIPYLLGCSNPELGSSYIENLNRLGLISIDTQTHLIDDTVYNDLRTHPEIRTIVSRLAELNRNTDIKKYTFYRTDFGEKFYKACIKS